MENFSFCAVYHIDRVIKKIKADYLLFSSSDTVFISYQLKA